MHKPKARRTPLCWDKEQQPFSPEFNDIYFSRHSGIEESRYVFLKQNQLPERWKRPHEDRGFLIAELGFGTGLNFLVTWQAWSQQHPALSENGGKPTQALHYFSVEKYPLTQDELARSCALWPELAPFAEQLLESYPPHPATGLHKIHFEHLTLTLFFGDAFTGLSELLPTHPGSEVPNQIVCSLGANNPCIDAWYLDGFAPARNPDMWTQALFSLMASLSQAGTRFATFTSAGAVRRGLHKAGFQCEKIKGFASKREMLRGYFSAPGPTDNKIISKREWYTQAHLSPARLKDVAIIGGGIAGCLTAYALARRNFRVTVYERRESLAMEASGNRRGVVYSRLSPHRDALSLFNLYSLIYACNFYQNSGLFAACGDQSGVLHLCKTEKNSAYYSSLAKEYAQCEQFLKWLDRAQSEEYSNYTLAHDSLLLPRSGWLDPEKLCQTLCEHHNITVVTKSNITGIEQNGVAWRLLGEAPNDAVEAHIAIIANAFEARRFPQTAFLNLKEIRGQVSYFSHKRIRQPKTVLCADGYITPLDHNALCVGASFNLNDSNTACTADDHRSNLVRLGGFSAELAELARQIAPDSIEGRVAFRCSTPDYFPIVGPVPEVQSFVREFAILRKKAKSDIDKCGVFHPNLYALTGLGSRGLSYAPIAADILSSIICGEPLPLVRSSYLHLHPARFIVRNLIRNSPIRELHC